MGGFKRKKLLALILAGMLGGATARACAFSDDDAKPVPARETAVAAATAPAATGETPQALAVDEATATTAEPQRRALPAPLDGIFPSATISALLH